MTSTSTFLSRVLIGVTLEAGDLLGAAPGFRWPPVFSSGRCDYIQLR